MTGETLYLKAQNGGKGFPAWEKLPAGQKGLWNSAALEAGYEKDLAVADARSFEAGLVLGHLSRHDALDVSDAEVLREIESGLHRTM